MKLLPKKYNSRRPNKSMLSESTSTIKNCIKMLNRATDIYDSIEELTESLYANINDCLENADKEISDWMESVLRYKRSVDGNSEEEGDTTVVLNDLYTLLKSIKSIISGEGIYVDKSTQYKIIAKLKKNRSGAERLETTISDDYDEEEDDEDDDLEESKSNSHLEEDEENDGYDGYEDDEEIDTVRATAVVEAYYLKRDVNPSDLKLLKKEDIVYYPEYLSDVQENLENEYGIVLTVTELKVPSDFQNIVTDPDNEDIKDYWSCKTIQVDFEGLEEEFENLTKDTSNRNAQRALVEMIQAIYTGDYEITNDELEDMGLEISVKWINK